MLGRVQAADSKSTGDCLDLGREAWDWHNWTQVEILAREAAGPMPSVRPTTAPVSLAREQAVRGERE